MIEIEKRVKKRGGDDDSLERKKLKSLNSGAEKLEMLLSIKQNLPSSMSALTEGARNIVITQLHPILNCYRNHFRSNQEEFLATWNNF